MARLMLAIFEAKPVEQKRRRKTPRNSLLYATEKTSSSMIFNEVLALSVDLKAKHGFTSVRFRTKRLRLEVVTIFRRIRISEARTLLTYS